MLNLINITIILLGFIFLFGSGQTSPKSNCPCIRNPKTNECISYDSQYQANSLEEAMLNFPDLTAFKSNFNNNNINTISGGINPKSHAKKRLNDLATTVGGPLAGAAPEKTNTSVSRGVCDDDECKNCTELLLSRLQTIGAVNPNEARMIRRRLSLGYNNRRASPAIECQQYRVDLTTAVVADKSARPPKPLLRISALPPVQDTATPQAEFVNMINTLSNTGNEIWNNNTIGQAKNSARSRRAVSNFVGERFTIGCIKRGELLDKSSEWISLCNACWVWRKLPQDYFPQYINELICDSDIKCLSGWGTCVPQNRNMDVLRNVNAGGSRPPSWQAVSLESSNMCECSVKSGSALHNFVAS